MASNSATGQISDTITLTSTLRPNTTTTTTTSTTTTTPSTSVEMVVEAAARRSEQGRRLHDYPVADMPQVEGEYDYSHFDYLNDKFEADWRETVRYAEENYEYEQYDYEAAEARERENADRVKQLKASFIINIDG